MRFILAAYHLLSGVLAAELHVRLEFWQRAEKFLAMEPRQDLNCGLAQNVRAGQSALRVHGGVRINAFEREQRDWFFALDQPCPRRHSTAQIAKPLNENPALKRVSDARSELIDISDFAHRSGRNRIPDSQRPKRAEPFATAIEAI